MMRNARPSKVWLVISSYRNDSEVIRILDQAHSFDENFLEQILVVDSEGIGKISSLVARRGWNDVLYKSYPQNLGSGANLRERLHIAAARGADYAYALNHDGNFDPAVLRALIETANAIENVGAVYPLGYLRSANCFNLTGTRELPLPALRVASPPPSRLIDVYWSSSNGALYSTLPAKHGILPWSAMWMGWEDLEYGWRLWDHGYRQIIVCDAIYADNYEYKHTWLGQTIDKPVSRTYYNFRNLLLATRRSRSRPSFYTAILYRALLETGLIALLRDQKCARWRGLVQGLKDGFTEKLVLDTPASESDACLRSSRQEDLKAQCR